VLFLTVLKVLPYLSYPRHKDDSESVYLVHLLHKKPDFDQVVHAKLQCKEEHRATSNVGATWTVRGRNNVVSSRLMTGDKVVVDLVGAAKPTSCLAFVVEEIHCVVGPMFGPRCDGKTEPPQVA